MTEKGKCSVGPDAPPFHPAFALAVGIAAVSTGAIFARLAGEAPPLVIAAYRVGLATLVIAPAALIRSRKELRAISPSLLGLTALSGLLLALHFATWITSLSYTSVANSVVLVNTNPLWVGLMTPLVTKERIPLTAKMGIIISVLGGIIISLEDASVGDGALWGDFLALAGSLCAAVYILLGRKIRAALSLLPYIFLCYGTAAALLWIIVFGAGLPVAGFGGRTVAAFWAMALIPQLIGHTSYNWSLKWFSASVIAVSLLGEPIGSSVLAYFLFDEGFTLSKITGGSLILFAIWLTSRPENNAGLRFASMNYRNRKTVRHNRD